MAHNPFDGTLKGSFSAHGHLDTATGDLHAICYDATDQNTIRHVVVGADGRVRREEPIAVQHGPSVHDCMVTRVRGRARPAGHLLDVDAGRRLHLPLPWNPEHRARVGLLKNVAPGSAHHLVRCGPCYVFHPSNGYETDDGQVIVDVVVHATMFDESHTAPIARSRSSADHRPGGPPGRAQVHRRPPAGVSAPGRTPLGQPYRYAYTEACRATGPSSATGADQA